MRLGPIEKHALEFIRRCYGWHTFDHKDRRIVRAIRSLERKDLVELSQYHQFRAVKTSKV